MLAPTLTGPQYLAQGLKLVLSPGLRLFVLLPLAVNTLLFIGMISGVYSTIYVATPVVLLWHKDAKAAKA